MKGRLISGTGLLVFFGGMVFGVPTVFGWAALVAVVVLGMREFYRLLGLQGIEAHGVTGTACGVVLASLTFLLTRPCGVDELGMARCGPWAAEVELFVLAACCVAVFLRQFTVRSDPASLQTLGGTLFGILYVPYLLCFLVRLVFSWEPAGLWDAVQPTGRMLFLYLVAVVKATDTGAYLGGRRFGRHKLIPRLSPAKTWEGLGFGLSTGVGVSLLYAGLGGWRVGAVPMGAWAAAGMGLLLALAGTAGDLAESLLKRAAGAKDSGTMFPGMGGLLDVLDSLLFGGPFLYAYAVWALRCGGL